MNQPDDPASLSDLLERLRERTEGLDEVSVGDIVSAVGERSFGPLVLIAGVVTLTPLIGDIPGVPTLMGLMVMLTLGQLVLHRNTVWIPSKLSRRTVSREKLTNGLRWMDKPARFLDRWTKQRMAWLVSGPGQYLMAIACMSVAAAMPLMEVIPFSANGGGLALTAFGLSIIARDGLLAILAMLVTGSTAWFLLSNIPW